VDLAAGVPVAEAAAVRDVPVAAAVHPVRAAPHRDYVPEEHAHLWVAAWAAAGADQFAFM